MDDRNADENRIANRVKDPRRNRNRRCPASAAVLETIDGLSRDVRDMIDPIRRPYSRLPAGEARVFFTRIQHREVIPRYAVGASEESSRGCPEKIPRDSSPLAESDSKRLYLA